MIGLDNCGFQSQLYTTLEPLIFTHDINYTLSYCSAEESILLKLDIDSHQRNVCHNPRCYSKRNALVLFKFKTLTEQNRGDDIENPSSLRYKIKFLSTTDELNKAINSDSMISLSKSESQGSVYTFSKASGSLMYLRDGGIQWKCDKTLERLNYTIEWTPMDMQSHIALYRFEGLLLQNRMYLVGAYPPTPEMAGGLWLNCNYDGSVCNRNNNHNNRRFAFSTEALYGQSNCHIYKVVTDVEESFSIILTRIDYRNICESKKSELLLVILTEVLDSKHCLNVQEIDKHCVFYPGVYYDPAPISEVSNSTLLRIS